jgi:hypothetical protein
LHTGLSLDAGLFGNTLVPDDAYRFARGQEITSSTGIPVKLPRPLDWMVLTDHTDLMGFAADIQSGTPNIVASANGKEWHEGFVNGGKETGAAAFDLISHFAQMTLPAELVADYENRDVGNLDISQLKKPVMLKGDYAPEALKQGLALAAKLGYDPYKFGFGGATDSHTSLATADEDNFFGKSSSVESSADRISHPFVSSEIGTFEGYTLVAFGYTGIWAHENTRGALFDAMERRETYGTTGPRMTVRFF